MKKIILASVAAAALANVAAANETASVQWTGTVADLENACVFTKNVDGAMSYDEGFGTFFVTEAAVIKVEQRGGAELLIESASNVVRTDGGSAHGHNEYDVQVNYMAGDVPTTILQSQGAGNDKLDITADSSMVTHSKGTGFGSTASLEVAEGWRGLNIELGGKAKLAAKDSLIENGDYAIEHTATCIQ